ncbi:unnamed protein product [Rhizophagus irregularis]|nr:unnamed protein product [Rhizophagus irregularis]
MTSSNFIHIDFDISCSYPTITNINTVSTTPTQGNSTSNTRKNTLPTKNFNSVQLKPFISLNNSSLPSLGKKKPLKISFEKFHVTCPSRAGYNKIYEIRRSKSFFFEDKLLARKAMISSRADTAHDRNTLTKTFFNFSYKRYRFYFGLYIPCPYDRSHFSSKHSLGKCKVPTPFVMSHGRRACVIHQGLFFKERAFKNLKTKKLEENKMPLTNDKSSHANLLHHQWKS